MESIRTVDIHLLELRYAHCRIMNHQALKRLRDSIETYGQIVPALAIEEKDKLILIDGYLRVRALCACGKDRICVQFSSNSRSRIYSQSLKNIFQKQTLRSDPFQKNCIKSTITSLDFLQVELL